MSQLRAYFPPARVDWRANSIRPILIVCYLKIHINKLRTRKFWIIAVIAFIDCLNFTILIPIIYLYAKQFGLNAFQVSLLFSIYSAAEFFATPGIAGMTIDIKNLNSYDHSLYLAGILSFLVLLLAVFTRRKYTVKAIS